MMKAAKADTEVLGVWPEQKTVPEGLPERAAEYLAQAISTLHAPSASIVVSCSAIDSMLKDKGYSEGTLYARIDKCAADHVLTKGMAEWAHEVRLGANGQRHADESEPLPDIQDAKRVLEYAEALVVYLYTLPGKRENASKTEK